MELGPAEARLSGEAADDSELPPATVPSSVGQGGRPRLNTHTRQRPTVDQLVFPALVGASDLCSDGGYNLEAF